MLKNEYVAIGKAMAATCREYLVAERSWRGLAGILVNHEYCRMLYNTEQYCTILYNIWTNIAYNKYVQYCTLTLHNIVHQYCTIRDNIVPITNDSQPNTICQNTILYNTLQYCAICTILTTVLYNIDVYCTILYILYNIVYNIVTVWIACSQN